MKINVKQFTITFMVILVMLSACKGPSSEQTSESTVSSEYTITALNPQGHVKKDKVLAPRLDTLEGKKIAMWLNSTPEQLYAGKGAELYDLLEDSLKEKYSNIEIVRYTELPMKYSPQDEVVEAIVETQPDAVVAGFGG
jgi:ABC-type Fe3+-hydroxamate transport system substrate-binding protein